MKFEVIRKEEKSQKTEFQKLTDVLWMIAKEGNLDEEFVVYEYRGKKINDIYLMRNKGYTVLIEIW